MRNLRPTVQDKRLNLWHHLLHYRVRGRTLLGRQMEQKAEQYDVEAVTMAHANGPASRSRPNRAPVGRSSRAAQTCANLPRARARLGAGNPSVQGLERACRKGGYL
jgi:hypothetical protein